MTEEWCSYGALPNAGAMANGRPRASFEYVEGWGMAIGAHGRVLRPRSVEEIRECYAIARRERTTLGLRGGGCSYGDASVNAGGLALDVSAMNRILAFDRGTGIAELEAGVTIEQLWKHVLPLGFWPKVVSGTMFPTVAGAAAMNIHGKNNYKVGTFGDNVVELDIVLPNGELRTCSRERDADLFHAAIGGFGMLGCFSRVVVRTKAIHSGDLEVKGISVHDLAEMMAYMDAHTADADYLVGWIDCFAKDENAGRGLVHHARYLDEGADPHAEQSLTVAHQELPGMILGVVPKGEVWRVLRCFGRDAGVRLINFAKYHAGRMEGMRGWYRQSHAGFNFLLDYVPNWKFAYGRRENRGLIQYQAFLPKETALDAYRELLHLGQRRGFVSYLGVFKRHRPDPFWMTHSCDGWSLALDFKVTPATREALWRFCDEMTAVVLAARGKFYFAKDLVIGARTMRAMLPEDRREAFLRLKRELDPERILETNLWRRVFEGEDVRTAPALAAGEPP